MIKGKEIAHAHLRTETNDNSANDGYAISAGRPRAHWHSPEVRSIAGGARKTGSTTRLADPAWRGQAPVIRRLLHGPALQPKLTIGAPNDAYEREADRVADRVMRLSDAEVQTTPASPALQRLCPECKEERRTKPESGGTDPAAPLPPIVHDVLRSPGRPLDAASRAFFDPRFGRSFDDVRARVGGNHGRVPPYVYGNPEWRIALRASALGAGQDPDQQRQGAHRGRLSYEAEGGQR